MTEINYQELSALEETIKKTNYSENPEFKVYGVSDGVINKEEYIDAKYKILWLLREPYESDKVDENKDKVQVGRWSLTKALNKRKDWKQTVESKGGVQTYRKLIQTTYAILNPDNLGFIKNSYKDSFEFLKKVACINLKKEPGKSASNIKVINEHFRKNKSWLKRQIELCDADIIIYGGTFKKFFLFDKKPLAEVQLNANNKKYKKGKYFILDGKLHINTYHPSCRMSDKDYCNNILEAVRDWEKSR